MCAGQGQGRCTYACYSLHVQLHHRSGAIFAEGQGFSRSAILSKKDTRKRGRWGLNRGEKKKEKKKKDKISGVQAKLGVLGSVH